MPKYFYRCKNEQCLHAFTTYHSMKEILSYCPKCDSEDSLVRVPKLGYILYKVQEEKLTKAGKLTGKKTGDIVKEHIDENKDILKEERQKAKKSIDLVALYEDVETYEP